MSAATFLKSMTIPRWIILVGGLGAVALGYNGWRLHQERTMLDAALEPDGLVERTSAKIQSLGKQFPGNSRNGTSG